ncbi:MAG: hypothetical protein ACI9HE_002570, partial [Planctomycetota bacterium]
QTAVAQSGNKSKAAIEAEITFAKGLASEWGFVDLAEGVVAELEKARLSGKMSESLGLVKCDIYSEAARAEKDPPRRRELFTQALDSYTLLIENNPNSELRGDAETKFIASSFLFGRYLERDLEVSVGEERGTLNTLLVDVLTSAVNRTGDLIQGLKQLDEERTQAQNLQLYTLILYRGQMLGTIARNGDDNEYFFGEAIDALQEMDFIAGEGTPPALQAYVAIGNIYSYQEKHEDAAAYFEAVVLQTIPPDPAEWAQIKSDRGLSPADVAIFFTFMEMASKGTIESYLALGDTETAMMYGMHFLNTLRREGMTLENPGYESLLTVGRALVSVGGFIGGDLTKGNARWFATQEELEAAKYPRRQRKDAISVAMSIANQVNEERANSYLKPRAQKLMAKIAERPGVTVSAQDQLEGIRGLYNSGEYQDAVTKLRGLLGTLQASDQATQLEFGAQVMNTLGNSYRKLDRDLESALAFREAVTTYKAADPELNATNAKSFNTMMRAVVRASGDSEGPLNDLATEAEAAVVEMGSSGVEAILWRSGMSLMTKRDYEGAIEKFEQIALDTDYGERAYVQIGVAEFTLKNRDEALVIFERYLDEIMTDPQYATESPSRLGKRHEAQAAAEYHRARIKYGQKKYDEVIELAAKFHLDFAEQVELANTTLDMLMRSNLRLGDRVAARNALATMLELYPDTKRSGDAGKVFYNELAEQLKALAADESPAEILLEMANHLERSRLAGDKDFAILWNLALHWSELGDILDAEADKAGSGRDPMAEERFGRAEIVLNVIHGLYADDEERREDVIKRVDPKLGEVLLRLKRVEDAHAVLAPLVMVEGSTPAKQTVLGWARSISGWLEGGGSLGPIVEIAGAGGVPTEEFEKAIKNLNAISKSRTLDAYTSCAWYEVKFSLAYVYYGWSKSDSSKKASIGNNLNAISSQLSSSDWSDVDKWCMDEEGTDEATRKRFGNFVLRDRFRWLQRKSN